jgi:branched-chain amino acid transport system ATP-binding protein
MLEVCDIDVFYGKVQVLKDLSLDLSAGEVLCLFGRNGAGKTTTLKAIMGLVRPRAGRIVLGGVELTALPAHEVPRHGIAYVPQGRRLFAELTVKENLAIGLMVRNAGTERLDFVLSLFPLLRERLQQRAGSLSGGEQQMLAMARALAAEPKVILLDEPTEGLMPSMVATIRESILKLRGEGVAAILVEQRVDAVLPVADRVAFIETGRLQAVMEAGELRKNPELMRRYVGVS